MSNISDVIIHINESLDAEARTTLENSVRKVEGVVSPGFNAGKAHLLLVTYDTETTNSMVLLETVRAAGYTGQVVGM